MERSYKVPFHRLRALVPISGSMSVVRVSYRISPSICSLGQRVRSIEPWILVDPPAICRSRIALPRFCLDSSIDQASGFVIRAVFRDICLWCSSAADSSPRTKAESLACRCGRSRVPR